MKSLYYWYKHMIQEGLQCGYVVNGLKSLLIIKSVELSGKVKEVFSDGVNITTEATDN